MALYKNLGQFCNTCKIAGQPDNNLIAGMHILSRDYEYSNSEIGQELVALAIGSADVGLEDIYGMALLAGNVYDDIEKNEELGAKLVIDSAERGNVESVYPAAMCLIGGIGVERDPERAKMISLNALNSCTNEQERYIALKSDEDVVFTLLKYEQDPEAAQEYAVQTINDLGSSTHDDLLEASGGRLFNQEIVNRLQIAEFDEACGKGEPQDAPCEDPASREAQDPARSAFEIAFSSKGDAAVAPRKDVEYREGADAFLSAYKNPDNKFAVAFELFSTSVEGQASPNARQSLLDAATQAQETYVWAYALALLTGEVFDDIPQDVDLAVELLRIGDQRYIGISQHLLAACCFLGVGVDFDPESAIAYWVKSEAAGFTRASEARKKVVSVSREEMQDYLIDFLKEFSNTTREILRDDLGTSVFSDTLDYMDLYLDETPQPESKVKGFIGKLFGR